MLNVEKEEAHQQAHVQEGKINHHKIIEAKIKFDILASVSAVFS